VSKYPNMTNGCKTTWNFFGSGHGKGSHDGVGLSSKDSFERNNLMLMVPNYKMQRKLFNFCMNIYQRD
jgi:hypothetical protein